MLPTSVWAVQLRSCWTFTAEFSKAFNEGHRWVLNASQDMLAKLPTRG